MSAAEFTDGVLLGQDVERKRIAQELHDDIGQGLALVGFDLNDIEQLVRISALRPNRSSVPFARASSRSPRTSTGSRTTCTLRHSCTSAGERVAHAVSGFLEAYRRRIHEQRGIVARVTRRLYLSVSCGPGMSDQRRQA